MRLTLPDRREQRNTDRSDLAALQLEEFHDALRPGIEDLSRLKRRMELTGFPPDDKMYRLVVEVLNELRSLLSYL
jgi:hypothetical protein